MLPDNLAVLVTDVLNFHQKKGRVFVPARPFSALTLRLKTPGKYAYKNKTVAFEPSCICIIPAGLAYERSNLEEDILVVHFNMLNFTMDDIQVFKISDAQKYKRLFTKALSLKYENDVGCTYRITSVVYEILSELTRDVGFTASPKDNRIIESADYMRQNLWNPQLSVENLAKSANLSAAFYRREFNRIYGTSPKNYLDNLRIQYAKSLIETGYFSQKEVASRCGFSDVGYFRNVFKRKTGKSIREYFSDPSKNNR